MGAVVVVGWLTCPLSAAVGVDRQKYSIQIPLPPRIDPTVTMMTVEEKAPASPCSCLGGPPLTLCSPT